MTKPARDEILERIRAALGPTRPPAADVVRAYRSSRQPGSVAGAAGAAAADLNLLEERLRDYRALVRRCRPNGINRAVEQALQDRHARRVVVPPRLTVLLPAAVTAVIDDGLAAEQLDAVDAVVTGCAVAIAETGTIVLDGSPGQGRRAITLVPDYHLCIVHATQVVGTVPEAIARLEPTRPQTWISGPSATSDIELQRVEGVHGPRTLEVILVLVAGTRHM